MDRLSRLGEGQRGTGGTVDHGRQIGGTRRLFGEQLVERPLARVGGESALAATDDVLVLVVGPHVQLRERKLPGVQSAAEKFPDVSGEGRGREVPVEHVVGVVQADTQARLAVERLHHDGERVGDVDRSHDRGGPLHSRDRLRPGEAQVGSGDVEESTAVGALHGGLAEDVAVRQPLVLSEPVDLSADPLGEFDQRQVLRHWDAHRQTVGELAHDRAFALGATVQEGNPEHDLVGLVDTSETHRERREQVGEGGRARVEDAPHQLLADREGVPTAAGPGGAGTCEEGGLHTGQIFSEKRAIILAVRATEGGVAFLQGIPV
ncbi:hypothetical protein GCM10027028_55040 [Streptomyces sundarbansensis]